MSHTKTATESSPVHHLYRVLEDEYVCLHGPLPSGYPWLFLQSHVKGTRCLVEKLVARQDLDHVSKYLWRKLSREEQDLLTQYHLRKLSSDDSTKLKIQKILLRLLNDEVENEQLRSKKQIFANVEVNQETKELRGQIELRGNEVARLNRLLLEQAYPNELEGVYENSLKNISPILRNRLAVESLHSDFRSEELNKLRAVRLSAIYSLIHNLKEKRTALCLSGGGVRSATFNLGILQGLARHNVLGQFHYMSTVSGGGYIGSWLSSWSYRHSDGLNGVMKDLREKPDSTMNPEPKTVEHLRNHSNPQTPQAGVLSADSWTLVAVYLRNLSLNWMTFIPLLLAVLIIPRVCVAMVREQPKNWEAGLLSIGFLASMLSAIFTGWNLPSSGKNDHTQSRFLRFCLTPLIISSISFAAFWACQNPEINVTVGRAILAAMAVGLSGIVTYVLARIYRHHNPKFYGKLRIAIYIVGGITLTSLASAITGFLGWYVLQFDWHLFKFDRLQFDPRLFVCFGVPILLLLYTVGGTLVAGFTSRWTGEDDQEWWSRAFAWSIIVIIGWSAINVLVLYGPSLFLSDWLTSGRWQNTAKSVVGVIGVVSGIFTLLVSFSGKTSDKKESKTFAQRLPISSMVSRLAAPIFFAFLIILMSLATNWLLVSYSVLSIWLLNPGDGASIFHAEVFPFIGRFFNSTFELIVEPKYHLGVLTGSSLRLVVTFAMTSALLGWIMGHIIDSNKFSLHSYYGNRLKRTYLGAARENRGGNLFTGFDTCDNIQMHEMRSSWLREKSFKSISRFIDRLKNHDQKSDPLSAFIYEHLSDITRNLLDDHLLSGFPSSQLKRELIHDLNVLLEETRLNIAGLELGIQRDEIEQMAMQSADGESRIILNRRILAAVYEDEIHKYKCPKMLHIVCMSLNLAKTEKLAWQERKAETFTVSPLHSGNFWLGYRRSRYYGGNNGISLGTAFTISGAAASPNMGYMLSSRLASFLMSMFNVRMGWWLGNPGPAGKLTFDRDVPKFTLGPLVQEALSQADDKKKYVYLSDGGHFENLGLYEMVLRRCHFIVVSDASTDSSYTYDSLGMAIRKIRIDLGVPIEFEEFRFSCGSRDSDGPTKHCAIARIRYSCVDDEDTDGILIYVRPDLSGDEPRDILNYRYENQNFPQDSIADQFFDEPQFESYRMLGSHIMDELCGYEKDRLHIADVVERSYNHWSNSEGELKWLEEWLSAQNGSRFNSSEPVMEVSKPQASVSTTPATVTEEQQIPIPPRASASPATSSHGNVRPSETISEPNGNKPSPESEPSASGILDKKG